MVLKGSVNAFQETGGSIIQMRSPREIGKVNQFFGNINVSAGSRSDPGVSGLIKPSMKIIDTTITQLVSDTGHILPRPTYCRSKKKFPKCC
jgi:hypothetical protein